MKKVLLLIIICIFASACLLGCADSGKLSLADFDIYEKGEVKIKRQDFSSPDFFFETEQTYTYGGSRLETKRGIKLGDTAEDVAAAYEDIVATIYTGNIPAVTLRQFLDNKDEYYVPPEDSKWDYVVAYILYDVDGKKMDIESYKAYVEENGLTANDLTAAASSGEITNYSLNFCILGDEIDEILISLP